jgi:hypothetical protein
MASRFVSFKERGLIHVLPHIHDNLLAHIKGEAYWVSYKNHEKSTYHIEDSEGQERPIKFINHGWYYLEWKDSLYWTSKDLLISGVHEHGGAWVSLRRVLGNIPSRTEGLLTSDTATCLSITCTWPKKWHMRHKLRKVGNRKREVQNHAKEGGKTRAGGNTSAAHSCPFGSLYIQV